MKSESVVLSFYKVVALSLLILSTVSARAYGVGTSYLQIHPSLAKLSYNVGDRAGFDLGFASIPTKSGFRVRLTVSNGSIDQEIEPLGDFAVFLSPPLTFGENTFTFTAILENSIAIDAARSGITRIESQLAEIEKLLLQGSNDPALRRTMASLEAQRIAFEQQIQSNREQLDKESITVTAGYAANQSVGAQGGQVVLPGYASATFASGTFSATNTVSLSVTQTAETASDFQSSNTILGAESRTSFEIRVNTGTVAPSNDVPVNINVPNGFVAELTPGSNISSYVQFIEGTDDELLDNFELIASTFSSATNTVSATLPSGAFSNLDTLDGSYEAVIVIGAQTSVNSEKSPIIHGYSMSSRDTCLGNPIGSPLPGSVPPAAVSNGGFRPPPVVRPHMGVDLVASTDSPILAVEDGTVITSAYQVKTLKSVDARTHSKVTGWGYYEVLQHDDDGSLTLYAHLDGTQPRTAVGTHVLQGQVIGYSDSSGGVTGPHLHLEYNSTIYGSKIDPYPCITGPNFTLTPSTLTFQVNGSTNPPDQTVTLNNTGSSKITPVIMGTLPSWLTVTLPADPVEVGDSNTITVSVNATLAPSADTSVTVTIQDQIHTDVTQQIQVSLGNGSLTYCSQWTAENPSQSWDCVLPPGSPISEFQMDGNGVGQLLSSEKEFIYSGTSSLLLFLYRTPTSGNVEISAVVTLLSGTATGGGCAASPTGGGAVESPMIVGVPVLFTTTGTEPTIYCTGDSSESWDFSNVGYASANSINSSSAQK